LEPNVNRVKGSFIGNVARMAIPGGLLVVTSIMAGEIFSFITGADRAQASTMAVYSLAIASAIMLYKVCMPFNKIRRIMYVTFVSIFVVAAIFFKDFFSLVQIRYYQWIAMGIIAFGGMILYMLYTILVEKLMGTTPNIYKVHTAFCNGKKVMMVLDDVDSKDYCDVTVQMKGLKVLRADCVIFIKDVMEDKVVIGASDDISYEGIACAAAYLRKIKQKTNIDELIVAADDVTYSLLEGNEKGEMIIKSHKESEKKAFKPRLIKRLRLTF
jgi:hypothetical protein